MHDQKNGKVENSEIDLIACKNVVYGKVASLISEEKMGFLISSVRTLDNHMQKDKIEVVPFIIYQDKFYMDGKFTRKSGHIKY